MKKNTLYIENNSASFLDIYLEFLPDFNFAIIHCPHLDSHIQTTPVYGDYISHLDSNIQF
jgi:hypothetical protein